MLVAIYCYQIYRLVHKKKVDDTREHMRRLVASYLTDDEKLHLGIPILTYTPKDGDGTPLADDGEEAKPVRAITI